MPNNVYAQIIFGIGILFDISPPAGGLKFGIINKTSNNSNRLNRPLFLLNVFFGARILLSFRIFLSICIVLRARSLRYIFFKLLDEFLG